MSHPKKCVMSKSETRNTTLKYEMSHKQKYNVTALETNNVTARKNGMSQSLKYELSQLRSETSQQQNHNVTVPEI